MEKPKGLHITMREGDYFKVIHNNEEMVIYFAKIKGHRKVQITIQAEKSFIVDARDLQKQRR